MKKLFILPLLVVLIFNIYWIFNTAKNNYPDFAAFYYAGSVIIDNTVPNTAIYDYEVMRNIAYKYNIKHPIEFIYALPIACLFAPFALLPFHVSIVVWSFLSLGIYLFAMFIILKLSGIDRTKTFALVTVSLVWFPFLVNQWFTQSNSIILLLVALSISAIIKNKPYTSGFIIGLAALFKLFPIAIALVFGLKNWRILAAFAVTFGASLLFPGTLEWFHAAQEIHPRYSWIYVFLNRYGSYWFYVYAAIIALVTAVITYRTKETNYLKLAAITIPAVLLIMPIFQVHHMTIMVITYVYIFSVAPRMPRWLAGLSLASFIILNFNFKLSLTPELVVGLLMLWFVLVYQVNNKDFLADSKTIAKTKPKQPTE
jgi:hypothetical protein